ncbi:hypothetical protein NPIL_422061 [Nephila pilipes]|uniref:Uncharacterized protein n=1 Tax=Nephila pilipes TaxID=299642 RepID=A0A8X6IFB7_NEPPI|nr:hypothetical protein NPIL_422061 [Nephila pilipes]
MNHEECWLIQVLGDQFYWSQRCLERCWSIVGCWSWSDTGLNNAIQPLDRLDANLGGKAGAHAGHGALNLGVEGWSSCRSLDHSNLGVTTGFGVGTGLKVGAGSGAGYWSERQCWSGAIFDLPFRANQDLEAGACHAGHRTNSSWSRDAVLSVAGRKAMLSGSQISSDANLGGKRWASTGLATLILESTGFG